MLGDAYREYNFDGLVGPTHNYGGLSRGNLASMTHRGEMSNPKRAALEGLSKMMRVAALGVGQAVLPPHERPRLSVLRRLGFSGSDEDVLAAAARESEMLVRMTSSAAGMWTANAATVAPSCDTADGRLHLTPANLVTLAHRAWEADATARVLRSVFADPTRFRVHDALPSCAEFADEGAANHTRLAAEGAAVHLFGWGRAAWSFAAAHPRTYPARQTFEASRAVARLHQLPAARTLFVQQHPDGIDAGAFHSDVLMVGAGRLLLAHEWAVLDLSDCLEQLRNLLGPCLSVWIASQAELPVQDAVQSYVFNSQILEVGNGGTGRARMVLLAPEESRDNVRARAFVQRVESECPLLSGVEYCDLRQSMRNGGGPACLRLRVPLRPDEVAAIVPNVLFSESLGSALRAWIDRHYRDRLAPADLLDPSLMRESMSALDELTQILQIGSIYDFQRTVTTESGSVDDA